MRLMDVGPGVIDVFAAQLDGNVEGVPAWEQFGEQLLNIGTVHLRQFKSHASPTKAILNHKFGNDPSATLEDAFEALEAIGRKDVTVLVLQKLDVRSFSMSSTEGSIDRMSPPHYSTLLHDQRVHHMDHSSDTETGVTPQQSVNLNQALGETTTTKSPPLLPTQPSLEKLTQNTSFDKTPGMLYFMHYGCMGL